MVVSPKINTNSSQLRVTGMVAFVTKELEYFVISSAAADKKADFIVRMCKMEKLEGNELHGPVATQLVYNQTSVPDA